MTLSKKIKIAIFSLFIVITIGVGMSVSFWYRRDRDERQEGVFAEETDDDKEYVYIENIGELEVSIDPDTAVSSVSDLAEKEGELFVEEIADAELIDLENKAVNNIVNSYDENGF